jgi:hypothetical protein
MTDAVRDYLRLEWERKCHEGAVAAAKANGSGGSGGASKAVPGGVAYAWSVTHPGMEQVRLDRRVLPHKRLESLPRQVGSWPVRWLRSRLLQAAPLPVPSQLSAPPGLEGACHGHQQSVARPLSKRPQVPPLW